MATVLSNRGCFSRSLLEAGVGSRWRSRKRVSRKRGHLTWVLEEDGSAVSREGGKAGLQWRSSEALPPCSHSAMGMGAVRLPFLQRVSDVRAFNGATPASPAGNRWAQEWIPSVPSAVSY